MKQDNAEHVGVAASSFLHALDSLGSVIKHFKALDGSNLHGADKASRGALDLRLDLENFGPVVKGTVQLRPLTLLVGPNNSGKSYVSVLLHSVLSAHLPHVMEVVGGTGMEIFNSQLAKGSKQHNAETDITQDVKKIHDFQTQEFGRRIGEKLLHNFKSDLPELIRNGHGSAGITVSSGSTINITIKDEIAAKSEITSKKFKIKLVENTRKDLIQETSTEIIFNMTSNMQDLMPYLVFTCVGSEMLPQRIQSYYLPANRSGMLQAYKALAASFPSAAPNIGRPLARALTELLPPVAHASTHALTGTITDFISKLITIPEKEGELAGVARQMERDLLHGRVDLPRSGDMFPEIMYSTQEYRMPLHRASSSISEVAPLSLYLKHITKPNDLLIIEEPEAHLHPANQAKMAASIVRMIRAGLNVLITTHSPLLVEKLGHYVVAGMADIETRAGHEPYDKDYLLPDEVAPYAFSSSGDGYIIREIDKDDECGISQEEFIPVLDELNEEAITLQEKMYKRYADDQN